MIRVLLLDNDRNFVELLAHALRRSKNPILDVVGSSTPDAAREEVRIAAAKEPFDVFLIEHNLGPGPDGIAIFKELHELSPSSEGIIFSAENKADIGVQAYDAGAYRYLPKPFNPRELITILQSVRAWRDIQYERGWLRVLTEVAKDMQQALTMRDVAKSITDGGLRLGFERARLWVLSRDSQTLEGKAAAGYGKAAFVGFKMQVVDSRYAQRTLAEQEPQVFRGSEYGLSPHHKHFAARGLLPPLGDWVEIPLWARKRCLGMLALDNAAQAFKLREEHKILLSLWGGHVAAALDRVLLVEQTEAVSQLGRELAVHASLDGLEKLMQAVHTQVEAFIDVCNFRMALLDPETGQLKVHFSVENGQRKPPYSKRLDGPISRAIKQNAPVNLAGARVIHPMLAVPLRVSGRAIGAIVVQRREQKEAYDSEDERMLMAIADQVAGISQTVILKTQEDISHDQLTVLQHASTKIIELVEEKEEKLWHMVLTVATAAYGLRFNRAALFLVEKGNTLLRGRMGIGQFSRLQTLRIWRKEHRKPLDFERYLEGSLAGRLRSTAVDKAVRDMTIDLDSSARAFAQMLREEQRLIVYAEEAQARLPNVFFKRFGETDYALLPLRAGNRVLGLLVVDNIHNGAPLRQVVLSHLETLLTQAVTSLQARRWRKSMESIFTVADNQPLRETLDQLCEMAQETIGADRVLIHPLRSGEQPFEFDTENSSHIDADPDLPPVRPPEPEGVTMHILRSGTLVVPNTAEHHSRYAGRLLVEHPAMHEGIEAFIGLRVEEPGKKAPLGVLYLLYRARRKFTKRDLEHARIFASLASAPIRNTWARQQERADRAAAERHGQERLRELDIQGNKLEEARAAAERHGQERLRELDIQGNVLKEALSSSPDKQKLIRALLQAASDLIQQSDVRVRLSLLEWEKPWEKPQGLYKKSRLVRRQYYLNVDGSLNPTVEPNVYRGISGQALQNGTSSLVPDVNQEPYAKYFYNDNPNPTKSELDVPVILPIKGTDQIIGVFNIESPRLNAFTSAHEASIIRLAGAAAVALRGVERHEHSRHVLQAAQAVTASTDLQKTLLSILKAARDVAPGLSALTIWYREPESGRFVLGPYFGVRYQKRMKRGQPVPGTVVWNVMHQKEPIWVTHASNEGPLKGRFVGEEDIKSIAAIPLHAEKEVGAIFFNYRKDHEFTYEEEFLFPLLAEIAAASIWDAAHLGEMGRQRRRLTAAKDITNAVGTALDLDQAIDMILVVLLRLFPNTTPYVLTYNEVDEVLEFSPASLVFYHPDNPDALPLRTHISAPSLVNWVASLSLGSKQVAVENVKKVLEHPSYVPHITTTRSQLCVTLMSGPRLLGVLALESPTEGVFDEEDEALIGAVGQQVSIVIARAQQSDKLRLQTNIATRTISAMRIIHDSRREAVIIGHYLKKLREEVALTRKGLRSFHEIEKSVSELVKSIAEAASWNQQPQEPLCMDELLAEWVPDLVSRQRPNIEVCTEFRCPQLYITGRRIAFESVIRQLVINALESMDRVDGPGTLTVRTRSIQDRWIEVRIEDTGPGVPEDLGSVIFREQKSTKETGSGLGLLFARAVVEEAGGFIRLLPNNGSGALYNGSGALFAFTLPVALGASNKED